MQSALFDLTDKVAIVTGSTKGIGRAIAEELARAGAKVVISSRKADKCEDVAAAIRAEGLDATAIPCHIGKREDVEQLVSETRKRYGKIDILVCNAAVNPYYGPMSGLSDEAFTKVIDSNVRSNLWLCNLAIPDMAEKGRQCDYRLQHRRTSRLGPFRNICHIKSRRFSAGSQSGVGVGAAER